MRPVGFVDEWSHSTFLGAESKHLPLVLDRQIDRQIGFHADREQGLTVAQNSFGGCDAQNFTAWQRRIGIFYRATGGSLANEQSFVVNFERAGQCFGAARGIAVSQDHNQTLKCRIAVRTERAVLTRALFAQREESLALRTKAFRELGRGRKISGAARAK